MELFTINTGNLMLDGGAMFGVVPKVLWNNAYPANEQNQINLAMRCLLVTEGDRAVLIDNGIGDKQPARFFDFYSLNGDDRLEKSLNKAGFAFSDITDVILTHLHFDHCGGSIRHNRDRSGWVTTFPNATYWVGKKQWEWANDPNVREKPSFLKENFIPIRESGQLSLIEEQGEILPGIRVRFSDGHTEGQVLPVIRCQDQTVVFCGDLIPTASHLPVPWVMGYDVHPLVSIAEKSDLLREAVEQNYILFFEHDARHECCTVENTEKGIRMQRAFALKDAL